jgi:hypothetical protein
MTDDVSKIGRRAILLGGALALPALGAAAGPKPRRFERLGWAGGTPGGDGGKVIRVTSLAGDGPGSFRQAVTARARASSCSTWPASSTWGDIASRSSSRS